MEIEEAVRHKIEQFQNSDRRHMGDHLDIRFLKFFRNEVVATMPVDERTHQPFGLLHGGASVVLAETVASVGAWLNIDIETQAAVGLEINANHLKPMRSGTVTGTARPIHRGAQTHVWEIRITNEAGKLVCISRCTLAVIKRRDRNRDQG